MIKEYEKTWGGYVQRGGRWCPMTGLDALLWGL